MTLEQLRIFIAVAEREHVTRAAHALNLTQSATSAAIAALENRHGAALFERIGRGIRLTEAGRLFLPEARAVLARAETAARLLGDLADLKRGSLVISASQTLANYWLPGVLLHFHKRHPGIDVAVSITNSTDVALAVQELHADLGFVEGPVDQDGLSVTDLGGDELYLVVAPDHPWAHQRPGHDDLKRGTWILREPGSGTRAAMAEALDSHGIAEADLRDRLELGSNEAVRTAVRAGGGATILSHLVVDASLIAGELVRVDFPAHPRRFRILRHPERYETEAVRAFLSLALSAAP